MNVNIRFVTIIFWETLLISCIQCGFTDYFRNIGEYFGYEQQRESNGDDFSLKIPYEVSTADEKFIAEASKLTGVELSKLDSCQQRVVLKLQTDCHKLNDEQLAKMAVHLLNCQSYVEGRPIYPCTDEMTIKQCTTNMDSDTWTSYHLMSNRARAVCYSIRQIQFRGLAEHTVNKLMDAAKDQLGTLKQIAQDQRDIKEIAETTHDVLYKGQNELLEQQTNLQKAQFHGQLTLEDNLKKLIDEKKLITESHGELMKMTKELRTRLEQSSKQIEMQTGNTKLNHEELVKDLVKIQERASAIFQKIEQSSKLLMKQNDELKQQYQSTLKNLNEVNKTVHSLVNLVGGTRQALEERLAWVSTALGGTDLAVERIYLIIWHVAFMLVAMVCCAFLAARHSTRLVVATLPPLNLAVAMYEDNQHLDFLGLSAVIGLFIVAQSLIIYSVNFIKNQPGIIPSIKEKLTPTKMNSSPTTSPLSSPKLNGNNGYHKREPSIREMDEYEFTSENVDIFEKENTYFNTHLTTPTPPLSRNGFYSPRSRSRSKTPSLHINTSLKSQCSAKTRLGTPCKLSSLPGRDFCHKHQAGDSIMG